MKKLMIALALLGATAAHADINQVENDFKACGDKAESTYDMNKCADDTYQAADRILNQLYASIRNPLLKANDADSKEILKRLQNSERAWVTFRDANCSLVGTQMLNGSGEGPVTGNCLASATIARVKELKSIMAN